jgi:copper oxidase (laccase) domain-containing protein
MPENVVDQINASELEANLDLMHEYQGHLPCYDHVEPMVWASKNAQILIYGKPRNWKEDFHDHINIFVSLQDQGLQNLYYPNVSGFTGAICEDKDFTESFMLEKFGLQVFRHYKTDGMVIPKDSAGFMCTADCPVIIFHDLSKDKLIMAHAGLASLIDKSRILTGKKSRHHEGVIDDLMFYADDLEHYEIFVLCGISASSFTYSTDDLVHGKNNKKMLDYLITRYGKSAVPYGKEHGGISLKSIILGNFSNFGVPPEKINFDGIDTYSDPGLWSHTEFTQKGGVDGRNGILVIHR